jgi:hypothetical protein
MYTGNWLPKNWIGTLSPGTKKWQAPQHIALSIIETHASTIIC